MTITTDAQAYKAVMAGEAVTRTVFDTAVAYAKDKKRKRPIEADANISDGAKPVEKPAAKTVKAAPAKPAKAAKATKPAAEKKPAVKKDCDERGCHEKAYAKGYCSKHYTQHRRQDPAQRAAANEASRAYRARLGAQPRPAKAAVAKG